MIYSYSGIDMISITVPKQILGINGIPKKCNLPWIYFWVLWNVGILFVYSNLMIISSNFAHSSLLVSALENVSFAKFVSFCTALRIKEIMESWVKKQKTHEWNRHNGNPLISFSSALKGTLHLYLASKKSI